MRQTLYKRLQQLEEVSARARKQTESRDTEAGNAKFISKARLFLSLLGVEQQSKESLAEALCRALEIDCTELRRLLRAGIDPIHQYFTDKGVYEQLQTREAAGTIPGG